MNSVKRRRLNEDDTETDIVVMKKNEAQKRTDITIFNMPSDLFSATFKPLVEQNSSYLYRFLQLNKAIKQRIEMSDLWVRADINSNIRKSKFNMVAKKHFSNLHTLHLANLSFITNHIVRDTILPNCPKLKNINLSSTKVNQKCLLLFENINLEYLDFSFTVETPMVPHCISSFLKSQSHSSSSSSPSSSSPLPSSSISKTAKIRHLDLQSLKYVSRRTFLLCLDFPLLSYIDISFCSVDIQESDVFRFQRAWPLLHTFEANYLSPSTHGLSSSIDSTEEQTDRPFLNLNHLSLVGVLFDQILCNFLQHIDSLDSLLLGSQLITESCLLNCSVKFVKHFTLINCDRNFERLASLAILLWGNSLLSLNFTKNRHLENTFSVENVKKLTQISTLNLASTSIDTKCLRDNILPYTSKTLTYLNLENCRNVPRGFKKIFQNQKDIKELRRKLTSLPEEDFMEYAAI